MNAVAACGVAFLEARQQRHERLAVPVCALIWVVRARPVCLAQIEGDERTRAQREKAAAADVAEVEAEQRRALFAVSWLEHSPVSALP